MKKVKPNDKLYLKAQFIHEVEIGYRTISSTPEKLKGREPFIVKEVLTQYDDFFRVKIYNETGTWTSAALELRADCFDVDKEELFTI